MINDAESATIFREVISVLFVLALIGSIGYHVIKSNIKSPEIEGRYKATEGLSNKCKLLIKWLHENQVDMILEDGQLKFNPPDTKVPKKIKQLVVEHRTELAQFAEKFGSIRDV